MSPRAEYRIEAPDDRDGLVVGVVFEDGVGFTDDPKRVAFFERRGWDVEAVTVIDGEPLTAEEEAEVAARAAAGLTLPVLNADGTVIPGTDPEGGHVEVADGAQAAENADEGAAVQEAADDAADDAAAAAEAEKPAEAPKATKPKAPAKAAAKK